MLDKYLVQPYTIHNVRMSFFRQKSALIESPLRPQDAPKAVLGFFFELIQVAALSLAIIIPVRYFLIQPFYVKGASMEPSFHDNEYLIIDELSYRVSEPQRGDIVVFHYPNDTRQFFIKRLIGLPGERIEVADGKVKVFNADFPRGFVLPEDEYLQQEFTGIPRDITLKSDEYFVLGDNRVASMDSRYFGPVKRSLVVGRVWLRGWPVSSWKVFKSPAYANIQVTN